MQSFLSSNLLTVVTFLPAAWAGLGLLVPARGEAELKFWKTWAFVGSLLTFFVSLSLWTGFQVGGAEFQFTESVSWLEGLGVRYSLGVDGISLILILLTTFLMPITILGSFTAVEKNPRTFFALLLFLQTSMVGAFATLDLFLFYVFWEAMLIPMYFLIGVWGGKERIYAATKFFLYTVVGSLLMLVAIFFVAWTHKQQFGQFSMSFVDLYRVQIAGGSGWFSPQALLFLAFALAFAIKVPLFPLHTWLPDAHVQAPTAGSVILAGVLLKMGGYGLIRIAMPLFPDAVRVYQGVFIGLSAIAIVYGAWVAMIQPDVKKLVAYSSVSHMGYVVLGIFALNTIGAQGAMLQMVNHGISTGALFLLVGMIYERRHTRLIQDFGGISKVMPIFAFAFMVVTFSSVALPGTNGFIGEFLILLGSWKASPLATVVAGTGVVFGAVYMLWMFQRVMFGPVTHKENEKLLDLSAREVLVLVPLLVMIFWIGVSPGTFLKPMEASVDRALQRSTRTVVAADYSNR